MGEQVRVVHERPDIEDRSLIVTPHGLTEASEVPITHEMIQDWLERQRGEQRDDT